MAYSDALKRVADSLRHWANNGKMSMTGPEALQRATELDNIDDALGGAISALDGSPALTYDPRFGDNRLCICGHPNIRHFGDGMVTCRLCPCSQFTEAL